MQVVPSQVFPVRLHWPETSYTTVSLAPPFFDQADRHSLSAGLFKTHPSHARVKWLKKWAWLVPVCAVLNGGAAHRCCSTVAAGSCCHTGSRTKPPGPTSFPIFPPSSSSFLLPHRRLFSLRPLVVLSFTPSPLPVSPTFTGRQTHLHLPRLPFYSPAPASSSASNWKLPDTLYFR